MDHDAAHTWTGPPLERHQAASVSDGRKRPGIERRTVDQPRHARGKPTADPDADLATAFDHHVSAEATHQRLIGRGGIRQHRQAVRFRQLDRVSADGPGAAHNCDGGPLRKGERVQRQPGRGRVEEQRGRLRESDPARSMHDRSLADHDLLGIGATMRTDRNDVSDDRVADGQAADGAVSELVDNACNVHTGHVGRGPVRQLGLLFLRPGK